MNDMNLNLKKEIKDDLAFELYSSIRIIEDNALTIEGCGGIIAYTDSRLVVRMNRFNLSIKGDNLLITKMSKKEFNVVGKIIGLEFFPNDC